MMYFVPSDRSRAPEGGAGSPSLLQTAAGDASMRLVYANETRSGANWPRTNPPTATTEKIPKIPPTTATITTSRDLFIATQSPLVVTRRTGFEAGAGRTLERAHPRRATTPVACPRGFKAGL